MNAGGADGGQKKMGFSLKLCALRGHILERDVKSDIRRKSFPEYTSGLREFENFKFSRFFRGGSY